MALIIPVIFIAVFIFAVIKKVNVYAAFTDGIQGALKFTVSLLRSEERRVGKEC